MPLVHTLRTDDFRRALEKGGLEATEECDVFHEWLLYLFYGRPAFKVSCGNEHQRVLDEYLPVALVLKCGAISRIKRVFPFDSGAFDGGAYRSVHGKDYGFADFDLPASISSAKKVVTAFFGSNSKYLVGEANRPRLNPFDEPEVVSHFALIEGPTDVEIDDRRYTVEVQTEDKVMFGDDLLAIVMPHTWLSSRTVQGFLRQHPQTKPVTYCRFTGMSLNACHAVILERVRDYLDHNHYL